MMRTYRELASLPTFEERFRYLQLGDRVGEETFGFDRYLNQIFYSCPEWKAIRDEIIIRDNGCDLGVNGYEIFGSIIIHHMNPIRAEHLINRDDTILNPEYLICTTHRTHNAIHYGNETFLAIMPKERTPNDTCPWKR